MNEKDKKNLNKSNNKNNSDIKKGEIGEDTTKYGEFISSYFSWVSLERQKDRVEELENMTKKEEKNR